MVKGKILPPDTSNDPSKILDPFSLMAQLPLQPYHVLVDLKSGSGAITISLAKHNYDGRIFATDTSPLMRKNLQEKLSQSRLGNVQVYDSKQESKVIPKEGVDGVLLPLMLIPDGEPSSVLNRAFGLLKKGAWAAVIEKHGSNGNPETGILPESQIISLAKESGFRFSERRDLNNNFYILILRK
jgi:ubiquinone/menaquinone biosynthesis C-methylase UbiE